jgi:probable F420-dependent oxidoreductase
MKIGVRMPYSGELAKPDNLIAFAKQAEKLGFYALFMSDHIVIPEKINSNYPYNKMGFDEPNDALELLTTLAFVAAATSKINLMTGIMVVPYRNPLVAAKALANIDYLSKGRLILGAGAGWMREEFEALQAPFENRGDFVDESIKIFKHLWMDERLFHQGKFHKFSGITFQPKPHQRPHPPIWIGGESRRAIRRAAELGDGWMPIGSNSTHPLRTPSALKSALELLEKDVLKAGRKMSDLEIAYFVPQYKLENRATDDNRSFVGVADKIVADIKEYENLGVTFMGFEILGTSLNDALQGIEEFSTKILPRL